jgi:hypothetical protein
VILDSYTNLVYSPDDETEYGKGWYLQQFHMTEHGKTRVSELYESKTDALRAYRADEVQWEEWK